jgi:hypothetical protein
MYDQEADARLKAIGNQLVDHLKKRLPRTQIDEAMPMAKKAVGFLPIGDGPNKIPDKEIAAAIPRVEGILAIIAVCEGAKRKRFILF